MPSREESRAERLARWLIRHACLRLPGGTRDDRYREWTAELHAIVHDPRIPSRARRDLDGLLYAADQNRGARHLGQRPRPALRARAQKLWQMRTPSGHRLVSALFMLTFLAGDWAFTSDRTDFIWSAVAYVCIWAVGFFRRQDAPGPLFLEGGEGTANRKATSSASAETHRGPHARHG
jgi:hypothetical protein